MRRQVTYSVLLTAVRGDFGLSNLLAGTPLDGQRRAHLLGTLSSARLDGRGFRCAPGPNPPALGDHADEHPQPDGHDEARDEHADDACHRSVVLLFPHTPPKGLLGTRLRRHAVHSRLRPPRQLQAKSSESLLIRRPGRSTSCATPRSSCTRASSTRSSLERGGTRHGSSSTTNWG